MLPINKTCNIHGSISEHLLKKLPTNVCYVVQNPLMKNDIKFYCLYNRLDYNISEQKVKWEVTLGRQFQL